MFSVRPPSVPPMRIGADELERAKTELFFLKLNTKYCIPTLNFAYPKGVGKIQCWKFNFVSEVSDNFCR